MRSTAVILARGGSKGLPAKNQRLIAGRPCIEWTIDAALDSRSLSRIIVSSDAPALLDIARARGLTTHERSPRNAYDTATIDDAAREALADLPDAGPIVILYANVPIRPAGLIDRALALLLDSGCDSVQSVAPVGRHHPWWTARLTDGNVLRPWEGDTLNHNVYRRQDLPPAYMPDGGVIALRRDALECRLPSVTPGPHAFFGRDRRAVVNPEGSVIDIDTEIDLRLAEVLLSGAAPSTIHPARVRTSEVA
jgi:CMP-N-acetylneuraminic acid synthetase